MGSIRYAACKSGARGAGDAAYILEVDTIWCHISVV